MTIQRIVSICGDGHLRLDRRVAYLLGNAFENRSPDRDLDPDLTLAGFSCEAALDRLDQIAGTPSPSRAWSDLFWMHLPWDAFERELGPIRVLDLGCGSGQYGVRLQSWSGERIAHYGGLDVQADPRWRELSSRFPFIECRAGDVGQLDGLIPTGTNLIVSQSALEHVADDVRVLDQIHAYAHRSGRPLLQVHLVPSAACLGLYLWHGYRQYTPRALSAITARFADCSERLLVGLGGRACNALHWRFITWPVLIRRTADPRATRPAEYRRALAAAMAADIRAPQRSPSFYALLIHSNRRQRVLESPCFGRDRIVAP